MEFRLGYRRRHPSLRVQKGIGAISDTTLGGSAANVDITSISATYAHLLIVTYARGDAAAAGTNLNLRFNGDAAANYDWQTLSASAAVINAAEAFAQAQITLGLMPAISAGANLFNAQCFFIPHYAGSANNKLALAITSYKSGTTTGLMANTLAGGFWRSAAAINRITLLPAAGNFVAGTRVSLYGMGS
jgi:hypothetical protein